MSDTAYIYRWDRHGRKGQRCVVLAHGTMNSCLVRFEDGYMMVTSRRAQWDHLRYAIWPQWRSGSFSRAAVAV